MKLFAFVFILLSTLGADGYKAVVTSITPEIAERMRKGHSWHPGCPVGLEDLRYLRLDYVGFDGKTHGER
jgi:hypothetical protein